MKTVIIILLITMFIATGTLYGQTTNQPPAIPSNEKPEVLTRGPVNEAFAQPINIKEEEGLIVPQAPPPDVDETPPADRPVGEQFVWVPGYWAWDSDRNEHIWISGCWRAVPPGKYWVPGYWAKVTDGYRWVAGFWASDSDREIEYLPAPPEVTYLEPPAQSGPEMIWVPPCWYWHNGHYTLRAGYWIAARDDWLWVPSHYIWTPRGHVFVNGHWDYPFRSRGILFAPLYFPGHIHTRMRHSYSLSIVVNLGNLEFGLFTRPRYSHYYFGDYYDNFYVGIGIFPWFECVTRHTWYDPIYMHNHWRHRNDKPNWRQHERHEYERRQSDKNLRPPRTYSEMEHRVRNMKEHQRKDIEVAAPMKSIIEKKMTTLKFRKDEPEARKQVSRHAAEVNRYAKERSQWESSKTDRKSFGPVKTHDQPAGRSEIQAPAEQKGPVVEPSEQREIKAPVEKQRPDGKSQENPSSVLLNNEKQDIPDKVKVPKSPVVDEKKGGFFRKGPPIKPAEEQGKREERGQRGKQENKRIEK